MTSIPNVGGRPGVTTTHTTYAAAMNLYDSLPASLRRVLANAPFNFALQQLVPADYLQAVIDFELRRSTLMTYGPTHPGVR